MSDKNLWRWKMNVARTMGNSLDDAYIPDLLTAFRNGEDEKVLGMIPWELGRIGSAKAKKVLNDILAGSERLVRKEISSALEKL